MHSSITPDTSVIENNSPIAISFIGRIFTLYVFDNILQFVNGQFFILHQGGNSLFVRIVEIIPEKI